MRGPAGLKKSRKTPTIVMLVLMSSVGLKMERGFSPKKEQEKSMLNIHNV
jgi:hypothetical protein